MHAHTHTTHHTGSKTNKVNHYRRQFGVDEGGVGVLLYYHCANRKATAASWVQYTSGSWNGTTTRTLQQREREEKRWNEKEEKERSSWQSIHPSRPSVHPSIRLSELVYSGTRAIHHSAERYTAAAEADPPFPSSIERTVIQTRHDTTRACNFFHPTDRPTNWFEILKNRN